MFFNDTIIILVIIFILTFYYYLDMKFTIFVISKYNQDFKVEVGCYFFTVNLAQRRGNNLLIQNIDALRQAFKETQKITPLLLMRW